MMKKITQTLMALTLAFGVISTSYQPAEARRGIGLGIAAGIIGLGILGAAASARSHHYRDGGCYRGEERCGWRNRHCFYNRYGDYVCRGGSYRCWRPTYCD